MAGKTKQEFKWDDIDVSTSLQSGEIVKKLGNDIDCYIIVKEESGLYYLINIFTGEYLPKAKSLQDLINDNYKRIAINNMIYSLLALQNPIAKQISYYPIHTLDNIAKAYALQICHNVLEKQHILKKDTIQYDDYPAIVIAAKPKFVSHDTKQSDHVVVSSNYPWDESSWSKGFMVLLKKKKSKLGEVTTCKNKFGNCAEQHAVNYLLSRNPNIKIKDIEFSKAIRPRTGEIRQYCANCKKLFNL